MAHTTEERRLGDTTYRVTTIGALKGRGLMVRLGKLGGQSLASFLDGLASGKTVLDAAVAVGIAEAIREISARLTEEEFAAICDELALHTILVFDEKEPRLKDVFDTHFAGNYGELVQWFAFALEVNFRSFFGGSGGVARKVIDFLTQTGLLSKSPLGSIGTSIASPAASATARAS